MERQLTQVGERRETLKTALAESEAPIAGMKEELELLLEARMQVEEELATARRKVEELEHGLRSQDQQRTRLSNLHRNCVAHWSKPGWLGRNSRYVGKPWSEQLSETDYTLDTLFEFHLKKPLKKVGQNR